MITMFIRAAYGTISGAVQYFCIRLDDGRKNDDRSVVWLLQNLHTPSAS